MLGKPAEFRKSRHVKIWQPKCYIEKNKQVLSAPSTVFSAFSAFLDFLSIHSFMHRRCATFARSVAPRWPADCLQKQKAAEAARIFCLKENSSGFHRNLLVFQNLIQRVR
jgi:hypothetical protein